MNTFFKKYIVAVGLGAASLFSTSCSDEFLEVVKPGEETTDVYFNSEEKALASLTAAYSDLKDYRWGWGYWAFNEALSDNSVYSGSDGDHSGFDQLKTFTPPRDTGIILNTWRLNYRGINKANQAIDGISKMDESLFSSPAMKARLLGEARFLRALYHFQLVRVFGRIVVVDGTVMTPDTELTQVEPEVAYAFILEDLEAAEAGLWVKSNEGLELGRVSKGAAQAYLAKVNMYAGNYADAKAWAKKVIDSGEYRLDSDYANIFSFNGEHGVESIFEISFFNSSEEGSAFTNNGNFSTLFMLPRGITYGFGINQPSSDLAAAYDAEGDMVRKEVTMLSTERVFEIELASEYAALEAANISGDADAIAAAEDAVEEGKSKLVFDRTGYYQGKMYVSPSDRSQEIRNNGNNMRLMRYAEVLLLFAEASQRTGADGEAAQALNELRAVRSLGAKNLTGNALLEAILLERRLELAGENDRYPDLVRTGKATKLTGWAESNKYWPVPQAEVDITQGSIQ
ncbi:RagB/SusD family nutrient uptake outer membrane protein [Sediminitomix flava]|uniref:Putative outer membrane starch-binding protein n=1 Tax=Sediminitomix flava TaxID=379075 RepID=A0A315Z7H0_SEDFL|nr:RagB/SusD family nutrient uptake outer membrane protein [Sediminitomix flava]PWJ40797.1 putative outer membrane starch-binding protein [Sediminitomix flava]